MQKQRTPRTGMFDCQANSTAYGTASRSDDPLVCCEMETCDGDSRTMVRRFKARSRPMANFLEDVVAKTSLEIF